MAKIKIKMANATFNRSVNATLSERTNKYYDDNGFLVNENVSVARSGFLEYRGYEFGKMGLDYNRVFTAYRSPECFTPELLEKFSAVSLTNDHPRGGLTPNNFKEESVGIMRDAYLEKDGEEVKAIAKKIIVQEASAIEDVEVKNKKELSIGLDAYYDWIPGEIHGRKYDTLEHIVNINHLAIVEQGKAGPEYKLNNKTVEDSPMTMQVERKFNGVSIELSAQAAQAWDMRDAEVAKAFTMLNSVAEKLTLVEGLKNSIDTLTKAVNEASAEKEADKESDKKLETNKKNADDAGDKEDKKEDKEAMKNSDPADVNADQQATLSSSGLAEIEPEKELITTPGGGDGSTLQTNSKKMANALAGTRKMQNSAKDGSRDEYLDLMSELSNINND